jgi:hypothetical protein
LAAADKGRLEAGGLNLSRACRDPRDDKFLAYAAEGASHYLVSSDRDLPEIRRYRGVAIVNPGQFLLALELHPLEAKVMAARLDGDVLAGIRASVPFGLETEARLAPALEMPDAEPPSH